MTGSSLIALGLTWWQAIIVIIVVAILSMVFVSLHCHVEDCLKDVYQEFN